MEAIRTALSHTPTTTPTYVPATGLPTIFPPNPIDEPSTLLSGADTSTYAQVPSHSLQDISPAILLLCSLTSDFPSLLDCFHPHTKAVISPAKFFVFHKYCMVSYNT